jgi:hypothetical protein
MTSNNDREGKNRSGTQSARTSELRYPAVMAIAATAIDKHFEIS